MAFPPQPQLNPPRSAGLKSSLSNPQQLKNQAPESWLPGYNNDGRSMKTRLIY
jgi:hypothetical protein